MKLAPAALSILVVLTLLLAVPVLSQTDILFPTRAVAPAGPLPAGAETLVVDTPDGNQLHGVLLPAASDGEGQRTLILGFGGNAWNAQHVAAYLKEVYPDADVAAFHYRGYRPSAGSPSAKAILADAPLVHDHVVGKVRPRRTIAVGFSIGSGVAAALAAQRPVDGLILVTPFDSLKAVAADIYPWLPVGPFFQHEIDAATAVRDLATPVAILAAERDNIIPRARTDALRQVAGNLVFDTTIAGAGHNDIYQRDEFAAAMRQALTRIEGVN